MLFKLVSGGDGFVTLDENTGQIDVFTAEASHYGDHTL